MGGQRRQQLEESCSANREGGHACARARPRVLGVLAGGGFGGAGGCWLGVRVLAGGAG